MALMTYMREKPKMPYNGLTIILSHASRFDLESKKLISGYINSHFMRFLGSTLRWACDIRTVGGDGPPEIINGKVVSQKTPLLPGTKVVLLLGQAALDSIMTDRSVTVAEQRGSPIVRDNVVYIASFYPQDCVDVINFEGKYNPELQADYDEDDDPSETEKDSTGGKSTHGTTKRKNYIFWLEQDVRKAVRILNNGLDNLPPRQHLIYPPSEEIIKVLTTTKNDILYFDIETTMQLDLTCFGFCTSTSPVYCVPVSRIGGLPAYNNMPEIFRALAIALRDNEVTIHNSLFDLFVLPWRYRLPVGRRVFDTMLAHHRLYPEVEKSLGHCISLYTDLPYHKNEGVFEPRNQQQEEQLWSYNAKDVETMVAVREGIEERAKAAVAENSIKQVNASVIPYLTMILQGLRYDKIALDKIITDNDRRMNQLLRVINVLVGYTMNPNSPKQVAKYLYDELLLKKPLKDLTNEKTLLRLLVKNDVPVINVILEFRELAKETGMLKFSPMENPVWNQQ